MRQQLPLYGDQQVIAPNMMDLVNESTTFVNSFSQYPVCTPSRASMLTGMRPDETGIYSIQHNLEELNGPDTLLTIPTYFSQNGYLSYGFGKVFHHWNASYFDFTERQRPHRLNAPRDYFTEENKQLHDQFGIGPPFEIADVKDSTYIDGWTAQRVVKALHQHDQKTPFFMAAGFFKPHLPFNVPKKYWDMYDQEEIELSEISQKPDNSSQYFDFNSAELRSYYGVPQQGNVPDKLAKQLIHGYKAAISYVDHQIGAILDTLEALGYRENTIIVLWSDHGYKLGEYSEWAKHTLSNLDAKNVFMISHPSARTKRLVYDHVESVDIFPTLCELSSLPVPSYLSGLDVSDYLGLIPNQVLPDKNMWAMSQVLRGSDIMGYSLKSRDFNYNVWTDRRSGVVLDQEFYAVSLDSLETVNRFEVLKIEDRTWLQDISRKIIFNQNYSLLKHPPERKILLDLPDNANSEVNLYPNPSRGVVTLRGLDLPQNVDVFVYDNIGSLLLHTRLDSNAEINVSRLKPGLYIVVVRSGNSILLQENLLKLD